MPMTSRSISRAKTSWGAARDGGSDSLLDEPAHLLDHRQAVGGLHAGALQTIVEDGVFIGGDIEASRPCA